MLGAQAMNRQSHVVGLCLLLFLCSRAVPQIRSADAKPQELSVGDKKAIAASKELPANTAVRFNEKGERQGKPQKIDPQVWTSFEDYAKPICEEPKPISPKCVRCKDGSILCARVPGWKALPKTPKE